MSRRNRKVLRISTIHRCRSCSESFVGDYWHDQCGYCYVPPDIGIFRRLVCV